MRPATIVMLMCAALCVARQDWWMKEPIRWVQTNLRETGAATIRKNSSAKLRPATVRERNQGR